MQKLLPFISLICLTAFTNVSGLPLMAGGCNNHFNKSAKIKCAENDKDCQTEKIEKKDSRKFFKS